MTFYSLCLMVPNDKFDNSVRFDFNYLKVFYVTHGPNVHILCC